ncbi:hypothetical protein GCM10009679_11030 [Saccharothrix algeriensis]|uniref:Uncharacterized protein n=1 Tax=Catellatospora bangladeshensis TaxID=310355 RepID=A0A8J3JBG7_9ACTN|nr:hypothetical protein Cba03nite_25200 [Catellatospora bangladeshensis]
MRLRRGAKGSSRDEDAPRRGTPGIVTIGGKVGGTASHDASTSGTASLLARRNASVDLGRIDGKRSTQGRLRPDRGRGHREEGRAAPPPQLGVNLAVSTRTIKEWLTEWLAEKERDGSTSRPRSRATGRSSTGT